MRRALALAAVLLLAGCKSELNHMFNYDDVHRGPAAQASPPAAPAPVPEARQERNATTPPARIVATPPAIATPPGAPAALVAVTAPEARQEKSAVPSPVQVQMPAPVEPLGTAFCRSVATGEARTGAFDDATRRGVYARSLAQCMAIHGN